MNTIITREFAQYEKAFEAAIKSDNPTLQEVLDYIHLQRGKQLRPQLVLLSAALTHGITDKTIHTAVALELLHTATLIHDDVVDHSPTRRGKAAVQEQWSNKVAILVGDYILAQVINIIDELRCSPITHVIAQMGKNLSSGELTQLHAGHSMWISEKQYYEVIRLKTAELFAACAQAGAYSSMATPKQVTALKNFGLHFGMCFQLKDDILDYSDSEELGKPTMNDIRDGKATLPLIISLERAVPEEAAFIRQAAEDLAKQAPHIDEHEVEEDIKAFVMRYQGVRYAYKKIEEHRKKAVQALDFFPDSEIKQALLDMLTYAIQRER